MIENKIQEAIKPILSLYNQIELDIIEKIAEHFNINQEFINADYWYLEKLKELGGLNNETMKLLEKHTGKTKKELLQAMQDIGMHAIPIEQLNIATQKGALLNPEAVINSINIQNIIKHSYDQIEKTFLQLNKTISEKVKDTYTNIITEIYIKTNSGIYTYNQAILESLDDLSNKGISILTYQDKNGLKRNYDIVGTVRRDLLCATRGLSAKVNEEVIKESGNHIVRVSNHFGARIGDGEENYTNHAWWQEKQYFCWDYDGKATEKEKQLPDFMEHCNYGDAQGIVGINCKHFFTVWYGSLEKDKLDFTYRENKEQYKKIQQQRYLENGIRKWKRKQVIEKGSKNEEEYKRASQKTREWQNRLNDFTKENDLKNDYARQHVKDYKAVTINNKNDIILLPNYKEAIIPSEKFTKYALDISNPKGKDKARAFEKALGYNLNNADKLIENIREHIDKFNAVEKPDKGYGKVYEIIMSLTGENGKIANVKTGWLIDKNTGETRLTSAYVTSKKWKEGD